MGFLFASHGWELPEVFDANVGVQLRGKKCLEENESDGMLCQTCGDQQEAIAIFVKCMFKHGRKCSEPTSSNYMEERFSCKMVPWVLGAFRLTRGMLSQTKLRLCSDFRRLFAHMMFFPHVSFVKYISENERK